MDDADIIGRINGNFGKWQLRTVLLIFLCKIPSAWFMACIIFTAPAPRDGEYFCHPTPTVLNARTQSRFERILDFNKTAWVRLLHPVGKNEWGEEQVDFCNVYADGHKMTEYYFHTVSSITRDWVSPQINTSKIKPCDRFYHHSDYVSLVTDFNLVCSKDILIASTQFFHLFGVLTGGLIATYLLKQWVTSFLLRIESDLWVGCKFSISVSVSVRKVWCYLGWLLKSSVEIWPDWWIHMNCMSSSDVFQLFAVVKCILQARWSVSLNCIRNWFWTT